MRGDVDAPCTLQVDDFDLTVDSPSAAGPRSPDLAPQPAVQTAAPPAEAFAADHTDSDSAPASESLPNAVSARTAQWLDAIPSPGTQLDEGASGPAADRGSAAESATAEAAHAGMHDSNQENAPAADGSQTGACSRAARIAEGPSAAVSAETEGSRLTLTAPEEEEPCDGESSQDIHILRVESSIPLFRETPSACKDVAGMLQAVTSLSGIPECLP